jgi:hypothetical protein
MRTELVTALKRQATELLSELERVEAFDTLKRRMSMLDGIARGEKAVEEGRTLSHARAKQRMARLSGIDDEVVVDLSNGVIQHTGNGLVQFQDVRGLQR